LTGFHLHMDGADHLIASIQPQRLCSRGCIAQRACARMIGGC
jgi:hypothetical protein